MGGEGGGVLADWIVDLGEAHGHIAQTTSVAGVAQRTGATIYYLELFPRAAAEAAGAAPVLALIPTPGDVDVLIASELMEAGRALQRGLVTQDRTTLIASTHRVYAIAEKSAMGDGSGRQRRTRSRLRRRGAALHPLRHGRGGRAQRQRHQRGAVRRAVRIGDAALRPRGLRGHDPCRRCRRRRPACAPSVKACGSRWSRPTAGWPDRAPRAGHATAKPCAPGRRRAAQARCTASSAKRARPWLGEGLRRTDRLPGPGLCRAVPGPHGAHRRRGATTP